MKPSERLFKFPIKLYHQFYLNKAEEEERESSPDTLLKLRGWKDMQECI
jgi:hypothetical protein